MLPATRRLGILRVAVLMLLTLAAFSGTATAARADTTTPVAPPTGPFLSFDTGLLTAPGRQPATTAALPTSVPLNPDPFAGVIATQSTPVPTSPSPTIPPASSILTTGSDGC